jgi:hypothetical protein
MGNFEGIFFPSPVASCNEQPLRVGARGSMHKVGLRRDSLVAGRYSEGRFTEPTANAQPLATGTALHAPLRDL